MPCHCSTLSRSTGCAVSRSRGYALIAALILLVIASLAASAAVYRSSLDARREREQELLFAGGQIRAAIVSYRDAKGPGAPLYPMNLDELLLDPRFPNTVRHLRRLYDDPMTGAPDWVLDRVGGRIVGVHSRSIKAPLRHAGFDDVADAAFAAATRYADWRFNATTVGAPAPTSTSAKPATVPAQPSAPLASGASETPSQ